MQDERGVLGSLLDVARFVQYIRHNAEEYRVDPQRIACYGGSAGGVASLWLAFHEDMAEPEHADPVRRESTRLRAAAGMATPATLDLLQWDWILNLDGLTDRELSDAAEHLGLADPELLFTEEGERIRARLDHLRLMSADDPPIFVRNIDEGGPAHGRARRGHHPYHARVLKQRAAEVGLRAYVSAPRIGIDAAEGRTLTSFLIQELSEPPTDD